MTKLTINSGDKNSFYINNEYENSLIFIEFEIEDNSELDKDIIFKLYKYFNNNNDNINENNNNNNENDDEIEEKNFKLLFDSQRMDKLTKIILFCQKSNLYKIEFDNSYIKLDKNILFRFVLLKIEFNLYQNNLLNDDNLMKINFIFIFFYI